MSYDPFFETRPAAPPGAQRRSPAVWEAIRAAYLQGVSAPQLAERFGVSVSAVRTRAREEGWRRADAPDAAPEALDPGEDPLAEPASAAELRALAWRRASAAVRRGRLAEALGWTRLVRQLDGLAAREAATPLQQARAAESLARAATAVAALRPAETPEEAPAPPPEPAGIKPPTLPPSSGSTLGPHARAPEDDPGEPATLVEPEPEPEREAAPEPPELHDLHDLHAVSDDPPLPRPTGPALPERPPAWVRRRLGMG